MHLTKQINKANSNCWPITIECPFLKFTLISYKKVMIHITYNIYRLHNQIVVVIHSSRRSFPDSSLIISFFPSPLKFDLDVTKSSKVCKTSFKLLRTCVEVNNGKGRETERRINY
jgi:hypothetical protein